MIFQNPAQAFWLLLTETGNTLYMVFAATLISTIIGLPLGVILVITDQGGIKERIQLNRILGTIVNIGRSFPFAILIVALIPFTRMIVGTSLGTTATIVPLSIAAAPFVARVVESSLKEVDKGIVEAAVAMGSSTWEIITKVLIPEAMASIILGITLTVVNLIGYSAMAGTVGGGGLGSVAIQYGYYRYDVSLIIATVILLIILVQILQWIGNSIAKAMNKK
ncbi:MAG: D-methionine transport system permease protein [Epulopiscium sp.]|jgi:D-methionine transport system permease protein|uniref:Methionine ABC transporter permease MetI n=1 Tax=Defluviitalea raffinosedens TaxID=1450156 RepID=A0A7C8LHM4_9FIRM|nr:methionine ABC transporter permease [Defluviitalea raffinosedens]KAE9627758.1 methionine ABC transporter permease MetI [Defluviitalea raffinosedens]MBZ4668761.1 metI [Defluviitaleaceae bacterium]MDK2786969.1 D-methionine transport system permease protein [Candidatus Epulonipiscium sp.]HHW67758.1 ABC transporter permease [Candidatus Epulonipiscium sp.]